MSANGYTKEQVIEALHDIAGEMHNKMLKGDPPTMTLPVRTKQNISFDSKLGVYKYGKKRSTRDATSLGSARQLLRALHVTEFIEEMIEAGAAVDSTEAAPDKMVDEPVRLVFRDEGNQGPVAGGGASHHPERAAL